MKRLAIFALLVVSSIGAAAAADLPHQLTAELIETEHQNCRTSTGYGVDFVRFVDFDGDGHADVVLDYGQALCGGAPKPYCTSQGCLVKAWRHEKGNWRKVFEGRVKSWSVGEADGRRALLIDGRPVAP